MVALLAVLSLLLAFFGAVNFTSATIGVGIVCLACVVMMLARIVQAHSHEKARLNASPVSPAVTQPPAVSPALE